MGKYEIFIVISISDSVIRCNISGIGIRLMIENSVFRLDVRVVNTIFNIRANVTILYQLYYFFVIE